MRPLRDPVIIGEEEGREGQNLFSFSKPPAGGLPKFANSGRIRKPPICELLKVYRKKS